MIVIVKISGSTDSAPAYERSATMVPSGMPIQSAAKQADATAASMSRVASITGSTLAFSGRREKISPAKSTTKRRE